MEVAEEVEDGKAGHEVTAVFRHLLRLAAIRSEAIAQQALKKAHSSTSVAEGETTLAVKKGKKHIKDTAKKEMQQLLVFLEFVIGPAHSDEDRLQAQFHELFHVHFVSTQSLMASTDVQLVVEALQSYLDASKGVSSWQKKLGSYLLQHLQENREDPDNSLIGLPVHSGILKGCYEEVSGQMHLCEPASTKRSSSRRSIVRGAIAVAFPPSSEEDCPAVVKVEGPPKRKRRTRKSSSSGLDPSRDTVVVEAPKPKKKSQGLKLKGSWRSTVLNPGKMLGSETKLQGKGHKRSKSGSGWREDIEIIRSPPPSLEDSGGADGEETSDGGSNSRPQSPSPVCENREEDVSTTTTEEKKDINESRTVEEEATAGDGGETGDAAENRAVIEPTAPPQPVQKEPIFVRVLRTQEGKVTVAMGTTWPQEAVELPSSRVLPLHSELQKMLGSTRGMSQLVGNPLQEWYTETSNELKNCMETLMEERGVDVQRMKHAARQQEGDIKTLPFLLHCKEILESIVEEPPTDLLQELNARMKQEVLQLVTSGAPCFLPTREGLVQYLGEIDYGQEAMRTVTGNLQNVDTAVEQVALEKVRLLNGTRKDELSRWWLTQISTMCTEFLGRLGFLEEAVPENYIETAPSDIKAVRANLELVKAVLDRKRDIHGTQELVSEVKSLVYGRIDSFLEDTVMALAVELGQRTEEPFSAAKARQCLDEKRDSMETDHVKRIENNIKDVEYLCRMKQLEEEEQGGQLRLGDVVPVSGLVMSAFHRRENVLKTVIELWGSREPEQPARTASAASRLAAVEAIQACNDAFEDIGGDFVMTKKDHVGAEKGSSLAEDLIPLPPTLATIPVAPTPTPSEPEREPQPAEESMDGEETVTERSETCAEPKSTGEDISPLEREDENAIGGSDAATEHVAATPPEMKSEASVEEDQEASSVKVDGERGAESVSSSEPQAQAADATSKADSASESSEASDAEKSEESAVVTDHPSLPEAEEECLTETDLLGKNDSSQPADDSKGSEARAVETDTKSPDVSAASDQGLSVGAVAASGDTSEQKEGVLATETLDEADRALAAAEAAVLAAASKEEAEAAILALEKAVLAAEAAVRQRKCSSSSAVSEERAGEETEGGEGEEEREDTATLATSNESTDTLEAVSKDVLSFADSVVVPSTSPEVPLLKASPAPEESSLLDSNEPEDIGQTCEEGTAPETPEATEATEEESSEVHPTPVEQKLELLDSPEIRESTPTQDGQEEEESATAGPSETAELAKLEAEILQCELEELELEEAALAAELAQLGETDS